MYKIVYILETVEFSTYVY